MIALDSTALSLLFVPGAKANSVKTGEPISYAKERMEYLVERVSRTQDVILIAAPSLAELLVKLGPSGIDAFLKTLRASPWFRIEAFDTAAAVELGIRTSKAIAAGDKREGIQADYTKVRFDRQITCIAMVNGASEIITDDSGIWAVCGRWGFRARSLDELDLPPELIPPPLLEGFEPNEKSAIPGKRLVLAPAPQGSGESVKADHLIENEPDGHREANRAAAIQDDQTESKAHGDGSAAPDYRAAPPGTKGT